MHKDNPLILTFDFSSETSEIRKQWDDVVKVRNCFSKAVDQESHIQQNDLSKMKIHELYLSRVMKKKKKGTKDPSRRG